MVLAERILKVREIVLTIGISHVSILTVYLGMGKLPA